MLSRQMVKKILEEWGPCAMAMVGFLYFGFCRPDLATQEICGKLVSQYSSIFSTCFGFIFASVAILVSISNQRFLRGMRQSGSLEQVISYHWSAVRLCVLATASALVFPLIPDEAFNGYPWIGAGFLSVGIWTMLSIARVVWLFSKTLHYAHIFSPPNS